MDCPAGNQAYIFYNKFNFALPNPKEDSDGTTQLYYYEIPITENIIGIYLTVNPEIHKISSATLYKGKKTETNQPIATVEGTAGDTSIFFAIEPMTFGNTDSNLLGLALVLEGTMIPNYGIEFYGSSIEFQDGFFDKIEPSRTDRGGGVIELADGTLVQYKGYGGNRWRWKLGAKFVDKETLDRLDALYAERPEFLFAQEPDRYPKRIHRCIFESPIFRIPYTTQWKGNGYSIEMEIAQV